MRGELSTVAPKAAHEQQYNVKASVFLSVRLSIYLSVCMYGCLSVHLCAFMYCPRTSAERRLFSYHIIRPATATVACQLTLARLHNLCKGSALTSTTTPSTGPLVKSRPAASSTLPRKAVAVTAFCLPLVCVTLFFSHFVTLNTVTERTIFSGCVWLFRISKIPVETSSDGEVCEERRWLHFFLTS